MALVIVPNNSNTDSIPRNGIIPSKNMLLYFKAGMCEKFLKILTC